MDPDTKARTGNITGSHSRGRSPGAASDRGGMSPTGRMWQTSPMCAAASFVNTQVSFPQLFYAERHGCVCETCRCRRRCDGLTFLRPKYLAVGRTEAGKGGVWYYLNSVEISHFSAVEKEISSV